MTTGQCADTWTFHNKATVPQINGPGLYAVTYNPNNKSRRKKKYTHKYHKYFPSSIISTGVKELLEERFLLLFVISSTINI